MSAGEAAQAPPDPRKMDTILRSDLDCEGVRAVRSGKADLCGGRVTVRGARDILGLWAGDGERAKFWLQMLTELKNRGDSDVCIAVGDGLEHSPTQSPPS